MGLKYQNTKGGAISCDVSRASDRFLQAQLDGHIDRRAEQRLVDAEKKALRAMSEVSLLKRSLRVLWAIVGNFFKGEALEAVKQEHNQKLIEEQNKPSFKLRGYDGPPM